MYTPSSLALIFPMLFDLLKNAIKLLLLLVYHIILWCISTYFSLIPGGSYCLYRIALVLSCVSSCFFRLCLELFLLVNGSISYFLSRLKLYMDQLKLSNFMSKKKIYMNWYTLKRLVLSSKDLLSSETK